MKEIIFLVHQMGTQGSYLNHLDLQQYLKDVKGYKIRFYCENVKKLFNVIKDSRRSYTIRKGEVKILRKDIIEPETVITDFKTVIKAKELGLSVICKKLIIMDTIELTYYLKDMNHARFYYDVDLYNCLRHFYTKELLFLMPPNNYELFKKKHPDLNAKSFFKIININMLKTLVHENREGYFFRWDDDQDYIREIKEKYGNNCYYCEPEWTKKNEFKVPLKYKESNHLFDYKNFIYRRRKYLEYEEQFGRIIFEYILLGKNVYFLNEKFTNDGLTDYLKHYNIKFDGQKIITNKEELEEQMIEYSYQPWE